MVTDRQDTDLLVHEDTHPGPTSGAALAEIGQVIRESSQGDAYTAATIACVEGRLNEALALLGQVPKDGPRSEEAERFAEEVMLALHFQGHPPEYLSTYRQMESYFRRLEFSAAIQLYQDTVANHLNEAKTNQNIAPDAPLPMRALYERIIKKLDAARCMDLGEKALSEGRWDIAIQAFEQALASDGSAAVGPLLQRAQRCLDLWHAAPEELFSQRNTSPIELAKVLDNLTYLSRVAPKSTSVSAMIEEAEQRRSDVAARSVEYAKELVETARNLTLLEEMITTFQEAKRIMEAACSMDPGQPGVATLRAEIDLKLSRRQDARRVLADYVPRIERGIASSSLSASQVDSILQAMAGVKEVAPGDQALNGVLHALREYCIRQADAALEAKPFVQRHEHEALDWHDRAVRCGINIRDMTLDRLGQRIKTRVRAARLQRWLGPLGRLVARFA